MSSGAVVGAVDRSASARDAADWAADVAAAWGAPLELVHVVPGWPDEEQLPGVPGWLRELADAAERGGVRVVVPQVVRGGILNTLSERAAQARMVVIGSYGESAWTGTLAGSLAVALIDRAACPVAVVRGAAPQVPPPRRGAVVVGADGSPAADVAVDLAAELAASLGAPLVAAVAGPDAAGHVAAPLAEVRARRPVAVVEQRSVEGSPLHGLLGLAPEARVLVVGRHHGGPGPGVTLGATTRGLVESAPCPVLVAGRLR
jgi:nucleotide-binding universal stress UspA family protein